MLKQRIVTAIVLFVLLVIAVFSLPVLGWEIVVSIIVWQGALEWARLSGMPGRVHLYYCATVFLLLAGTRWFNAHFFAVSVLNLHLVWYLLSAALWLLLAPAWLIAGWKVQNAPLLGVVGAVLLLPTGLAMIDLRNESPWVLLGAMSVVWVADTAAYFVGRKFGKHKLAPAISPGKTWEGVYGALFVVSLYVLWVGWGAGLFKNYPVFPGIIIASWLWVGLAVVGDLFESAMKRQAGVKDSGALLPGHGGLLDRIDALTSTLPFAAIILAFYKLT